MKSLAETILSLTIKVQTDENGKGLGLYFEVESWSNAHLESPRRKAMQDRHCTSASCIVQWALAPQQLLQELERFVFPALHPLDYCGIIADRVSA